MTEKGMTVGALLVAGALAALVLSCKPSAEETTEPTNTMGGHKAHHGGCLNAIEACAVGHAEVKLDGDVLSVWFVGGEGRTGTAVRVREKQIVLTVKPEGGEERVLTLEARPSDLAEETVGDCSCFEGKAGWLTGVQKFQATGMVHFKGQDRAIRIEYPEGYDPDEQAPESGEASP